MIVFKICEMKFAYLIVAHGSFKLLDKLVVALDMPKADIFLHVDAKVGFFDIDRYEHATRYSRVFVIDKRIDVRWGSFSQVEATFCLLEYAKSKGNYDYYHLISGIDLPIKSNEYILQFFKDNDGKEFVGFDSYYTPQILKKRLGYYHLINGNLMKKSKRWYYLNQAIVKIQQIFGVSRKPLYDEYRGGSNWFSITDALVTELLKKKDVLLKTYRYTFCPDEAVIQSFIFNSPFYKNVYRLSKDGCMRHVVFNSYGSCQTWRLEQFDEIMNSPYLFARKFDENDVELIEKILRERKSFLQINKKKRGDDL